MALPPQNRSFYDSLVRYTQLKSLYKGRALHAQIIKAASSSSCIYIANGLVNFYAKCGNLPKARLVFERIRDKDVVSWNCLINGFSQQSPAGSSSFVMELFQLMRSENTLPNAHTFAGVFTAASNSCSIFGGQQAHVLAIKTASFHDVFVGSSLLNMYCKTGMLFEARKVFDRMTERNAVTWSTMISGYAIQRLAGEALQLFALMRAEDEDLNEFVFTSVLSAVAAPEYIDGGKQIHCLAVKNGLLLFVSTLNALVTMYAKCGSLDDSLQVFEMSTDKNSITWAAMITGYAQSGDSGKALKLFFKMHFSGIYPSEYTLVGVLNACSDLGAVEEGKQVHSYLLKLGFESQIYIMTALVDMYAKCGCTADAWKGFDYLQEPDIVLWTSMIAGYVQNGENEEALNLYGRLQMEGILPNELTMASVLKACSNLAALDQGRQIHARTIKYGLGSEVQIGSALSTMYAKCGNLEEGISVFTRMPERDIVSWNAMISGLSQNGYGMEALELFEEMRLEGTKPDDVTFVNVLSACSHMGLVERSWMYFKMMFDEFGINSSGNRFTSGLRQMRDSFIKKVVLSSSPLKDSNFLAMAILNQTGDLAYCRNGDQSWKIFENVRSFCEDVICVNGMFFAVNKVGQIAVCDVSCDLPRFWLVETPWQSGGDMQYLVSCGNECECELLLVTRYLDLDFEVEHPGTQPHLIYRTMRFEIFRLDWNGPQWVKVRSLGDKALFVGENSSLSLSSADFPGCMGNCIYFTDDYSDTNYDGHFGEHDLGIFKLGDGSIEPLACYPRTYHSRLQWPPPIWVSPNPC